MSAKSPQPTVVYVAGMGRSGTTLLAILLGAQPGIFGGGELRRYWQGLSVPGWLCGCGRTVEECEFWRAVRGRLSSAEPPIRSRILELQRRRLRLRPRQVLALRRDSSGEAAGWCRDYAGAVDELYRAVARESGADVVVDSSKELPDGFLLSRLSELDFRVVHLVRDPRAVVHSFARSVPTPQPHREFLPRGGTIATAAKWDARNACAEWMFGGLGDRYTRLSYEDLVANPERELEPLLASLGLSGPVRTEGLAPPNHTFSGNPRRFGEQRIELDDEWRRAMPQRSSLLVSAATWPVARRYGYHLFAGEA
jgi:sulfotransferase family protein